MFPVAFFALLTAFAPSIHPSGGESSADMVGAARTYQVRQTTKLDQIPAGTKALQ